ncbi:hypothetical protein JNB63_02000 [Microbacterium trichothecenolyticum]|uniref:hypothetical protein n=1 Tax=Microbacterium trichothecenolyticum TaxID=69370 RepID=UPI001C6F2CFE|nr:hypothetical protein [Microbacterium trichothecenolyticum]MBW9118858.1 hypothetical protein [Microbacterium trichothecenolyticum]
MTAPALNSTSSPSDVATAAAPSSPVDLSGALAASPSAAMGAPDTLALILAIAALVLALVAITLVGILAHRQTAAERARRTTFVRNAHRPPTHILSGSSLELDDEDQR